MPKFFIETVANTILVLNSLAWKVAGEEKVLNSVQRSGFALFLWCFFKSVFSYNCSKFFFTVVVFQCVALRILLKVGPQRLNFFVMIFNLSNKLKIILWRAHFDLCNETHKRNIICMIKTYRRGKNTSHEEKVKAIA